MLASLGQEVYVDDEEYLEYPPDEREQYVWDCIQEDFEQTISWGISYMANVPEDDGRWEK